MSFILRCALFGMCCIGCSTVFAAFEAGSTPPSMHDEDAMRMELEQLKKRVAYLENQLVLKKPPEPLSFSVSWLP